MCWTVHRAGSSLKGTALPMSMLRKGAALGRIAPQGLLVVEGCHEMPRLVSKFSAEQEASIGGPKPFDHVSPDWLYHVGLDLDPSLPPLPPCGRGECWTGGERGGDDEVLAPAGQDQQAVACGL